MLSWEQGVLPGTQMGTYFIMNALSLTLLNFYFRHKISVSTFLTLASTFETKIISIIIILKLDMDIMKLHYKLEQEIIDKGKCILYTITHNWQYYDS